jgi:transcriptional regulator of arginine metabolism
MPDTITRRRAVRDLISRQPVRNQTELVSLLRTRGFYVTQATVSRDLNALGAEKRNDHYALVTRARATGSELAHVLSSHVESIAASGNLVVVKTPPGAAQLVAAAFDAAGLDGVLGSVAGDDTVLLVASEPVTGRGLKHKLEEIGASA